MGNVLIASLGESPAVVTATAMALETQRGIRIDELVTISPINHSMIDFGTECIKDIWEGVWRRDKAAYTPDGLPCKDINTRERTDHFMRKARDIMTGHHYRGDDLYISISGGRKNMSAVMLAPAQLFPSVKGVFHIHDRREIQGTPIFPSIEELYNLGDEERRRWMQPDPANVALVEVPFKPLPQSVRNSLEAFVEALEAGHGRVESLPEEIRRPLCEGGLIQPCDPASSGPYELTERGRMIIPLALGVELRDSAKPDEERFKKISNGEHYSSISEVLDLVEGTIEKIVREVKAIEDVIGRHFSRSVEPYSRLSNIEYGPISPSNPNRAWKVGVWIYGRERAYLVEFISTARSSLEAVELWRRIKPFLPNVRDSRNPAVLIASLGDHAAVVTEAYQAIKRQGVSLKSVAWIYPAKASRIVGVSGILKKVFVKEKIDVHDIGLPDCKEMDTEAEAQALLSTLLSEIDKFSRKGYDIYLSLAGGRKTMSAMMFLAAQKVGQVELFHVLINDSKVEKKMLEAAAYEALASQSTRDCHDRLIWSDEEVGKFIELIPIPVALT